MIYTASGEKDIRHSLSASKKVLAYPVSFNIVYFQNLMMNLSSMKDDLHDKRRKASDKTGSKSLGTMLAYVNLLRDSYDRQRGLVRLKAEADLKGLA